MTPVTRRNRLASRRSRDNKTAANIPAAPRRRAATTPARAPRRSPSTTPGDVLAAGGGNEVSAALDMSQFSPSQAPLAYSVLFNRTINGQFLRAILVKSLLSVTMADVAVANDAYIAATIERFSLPAGDYVLKDVQDPVAVFNTPGRRQMSITIATDDDIAQIHEEALRLAKSTPRRAVRINIALDFTNSTPPTTTPPSVEPRASPELPSIPSGQRERRDERLNRRALESQQAERATGSSMTDLMVK